jgi:hypothetical protein
MNRPRKGLFSIFEQPGMRELECRTARVLPAPLVF